MYKPVHMVSYSTYPCTLIITVAIGAFSDLIYCTWNSTEYFFKFKNWNHILFTSPSLFPLLKIVMQFLLNQKTKQNWLYKFTVFEILIIYCVMYIVQYIHYSPQKHHPQFPLEESSMPQSKKGQPKGRDFRKDDFSLPVYVPY